jgi:hypothetical protein
LGIAFGNTEKKSHQEKDGKRNFGYYPDYSHS